jgi:hypothetical protein
MRFSQDDIDVLLSAWPELSRQPGIRGDVCRVAGRLAFSMTPPGRHFISDGYAIAIDVPLASGERTPEAKGRAPVVFETGLRIPRDADHHVNSSGSLCLGSPWAVRRLLGNPPSLVRLVELCVVPFLYAATWREQGHAGYPFEELPHGNAGLLADYKLILGVTSPRAVSLALAALSRRPREANKLTCPCGCGVRLGRCSYRFRINELRREGTLPFFRRTNEQFRDAFPPPVQPDRSERKRKLAHPRKIRVRRY